MAATFGHAWTSTHGLSPQEPNGSLTIHGDTWGKALAGLDGQQFGIGLAACIAEGGEFPPSAPRFRAMCLGIPTLARVRYELQPGQERCAYTRLVWQFVDAHRMAELAGDKQDRALRDAYDLAHEHVMRGGELPPEPVAAIDDGRDERAVRREALGLPPRPVQPSDAAARAAEELGLGQPAGKMAAAGPDA